MWQSITALVLVTSLLSACSEPSSEQEVLAGDEGTEESSEAIVLTTEDHTVPVADDSFECMYTGYFTDRDIAISGAAGTQGPGGHHLLVYYVDSKEKGHHPCTDAEMITWHQVAVADSEANGEPVIDLPSGLAFHVPKGMQIAVQAHYINTTGKPEVVNEKVSLHLMDPAKVMGYANLWTVVDTTFKVSPQSKGKSVSHMFVKDDVSLLLMGGHMHDFGTHFRLEIVGRDGESDPLYDEEWHPEYTSHPPLHWYSKENPLVLRRGTHIKQTCSWDNTSAKELSFPHEMCIGFGFYFQSTTAPEIDNFSAPADPQ